MAHTATNRLTGRLKPIPDVANEVWANARPNTETDDDGKTRRVGRSLRKGVLNRRVIAEEVINGARWSLHATKGWRVARP